MHPHAKITLPIALVGLALLAYLWLGWQPEPAFRDAALRLRGAVTGAIALMLMAGWLAAERYAARPLRALEQRLQAKDSQAHRALERPIAAPSERVQSARGDSGAELAALVEGSWEWELASSVMRLSPSWKAMLGFRPEEFSDTYAAWKNRVHLADIGRVEAALKAYASGGAAAFASVHRLLHKDASHRWVLSRAALMRNDQGQAQRVIGYDTDVTSLKREQEMLLQVLEATSSTTGEAFFRALVRGLAIAAGARGALVTRCGDYPTTRLTVLAQWRDGSLRETFDYPIAGTPCESVIRDAVARLEESALREPAPAACGFAAVSYCGVPISDGAGAVAGHIALLDDKPMPHGGAIVAVCKVLAARAAAELTRVRGEQAIGKLITELEPLPREERLRQIVRQFAELVGVREAIVTECVHVPHKRLRVLAWWREGRFEPYTEYNLVGTTCEETINEGKICCYPQGVGERFPPARPLDRESYLGVPCFGAKDVVIGHLAGFHNKPMQNSTPEPAILRLFADRAAIELRQLRAA